MVHRPRRVGVGAPHQCPLEVAVYDGVFLLTCAFRWLMTTKVATAIITKASKSSAQHDKTTEGLLYSVLVDTEGTDGCHTYSGRLPPRVWLVLPCRGALCNTPHHTHTRPSRLNLCCLSAYQRCRVLLLLCNAGEFFFFWSANMFYFFINYYKQKVQGRRLH